MTDVTGRFGDLLLDMLRGTEGGMMDMNELRHPVHEHACGWSGGAGEGIPCADPRRGPFWCPRCGGELEIA